jgi:hypothetical protein
LDSFPTYFVGKVASFEGDQVYVGVQGAGEFGREDEELL